MHKVADHPFVRADVDAALGQRYAIESEIAVGGQGVVYKATRTSRPDGTPARDVVALKLHLYRGQDDRVQREVAAMATISHPNLARPIEHGHCYVGGRHTSFVAWEFIEGETLSRRLKSGRLLESEVLGMGSSVAAAIGEIWSRRIVHGDIKPSNIMLKGSGGAVLIDLGAARHLEVDNSPAAREPMGTVGYFSPEQARGTKSLSCASDIFSLGVVMVQCLLGRHPTDFHQSALLDGIRASDLKIAASPGVLSVLDKMLSVSPNFRPTPSRLFDYFVRLQQRREAEFARSRHAPREEKR